MVSTTISVVPDSLSDLNVHIFIIYQQNKQMMNQQLSTMFFKTLTGNIYDLIISITYDKLSPGSSIVPYFIDVSSTQASGPKC